MKKNIFLTGATGFVGTYLMREILEKSDDNLFLLVRSTKQQTGVERIYAELQEHYGQCPEYLARISILEGDITLEKFGLSTKEYTNLSEKIQMIYHIAASVNFAQDYDDAFQINVSGTRNVIAFFEACKKVSPQIRLNYVGTAYISGLSNWTFSESDLEHETGFSNNYEKTKYEIEMELEKLIAMGENIVIFRPSIIHSSSIDGSTHENNVVLDIIKLGARERVKKIYRGSLNIVPIDYVVKAIYTIANTDVLPIRTFLLTSTKNTEIEVLINAVCETLFIEKPIILDEMSTEIPFSYIMHYILHSHTFDDRVTRNFLKTKGIVCPEVDLEYFVKNVMWCFEHKVIKVRKTNTKFLESLKS
ncbi:MAG: SDR family oxidoreductase [Mycoplasmatales bacterium]